MSIVKEGSGFVLACDVCGEIARNEHKFDTFPTFQDAVKFKKQNNWKSSKHQGEWEDVCPECQKGE
jgi:hypothetical protein